MLQITLAAITLPLTDPVLKFLLILVIILAAPLLLNKLRIPHLLGLIIAGAIIGPNGFNLVLRDSSIILSGTAGLLYIMFLAGLEIDLGDFKKNKWKSLTFGMYTFLVPMALGTLVGLYVLNFSMLTSILLASMFASHTLIAYPIISKLGITKDKAVGITVGGTDDHGYFGAVGVDGDRGDGRGGCGRLVLVQAGGSNYPLFCFRDDRVPDRGTLVFQTV